MRMRILRTTPSMPRASAKAKLPISLPPKSPSSWKCIPTPVVDVLNVTLPQGAVHGLSLMSVSGQTVLSDQVSVGGSLAWDVSALPAGAYVLKVVSPNAWTMRKVMIGRR